METLSGVEAYRAGGLHGEAADGVGVLNVEAEGEVGGGDRRA